MTLHIGRAIGRGIRRALNPTGIVLMVLIFLYMVVFVGGINTLVASILPADVQEQARLGLTFPVSSTIAGILLVVGMLVGMVILLAATRALTRGPRERGSLTTDLFTRRIGRAVLSAIGANIVVSVAVMIGFILLVVPGLFLAVSFTFVVYAIGVEDARALDALRRSWELASGNRWRLFALVLIVGVGTGLAGGLGSLLSMADPVAGQVVSLVLTAILSILGYGVIADAYVQLRDDATSENPSLAT